MRAAITRFGAVGLAASLAMGLGTPRAAAQGCDEVGSPAIQRSINDSASGLVLIYRGPSAPFAGPATVGGWEFYATFAGGRVTPLIFRVDGPSTYTLVAIGESSTAATGVNQADFTTIVGPATLPGGASYTVGFAMRGLVASSATQATTTSTTTGAVPFIGYNLTTDPWSYASPPTPTFTLGDVYGSGGSTLDAAGFGGRIYSATFFVDCGCASDINGDGSVNFADVQAFVTAFLAQNPAADVNDDGSINFADVQAFIAAFNAGC